VKWLIDAQLPAHLSTWLRARGHDSIHTSQLPDGNRSTDAQVNRISRGEQRILVTKDADFVESFYVQQMPYKLLLISTGNISNTALEALFVVSIDDISAAFETAQFIELTHNAWIVHE
jgi:predicted nuclease of predicted toxin-antitoxin system